MHRGSVQNRWQNAGLTVPFPMEGSLQMEWKVPSNTAQRYLISQQIRQHKPIEGKVKSPTIWVSAMYAVTWIWRGSNSAPVFLLTFSWRCLKTLQLKVEVLLCLLLHTCKPSSKHTEKGLTLYQAAVEGYQGCPNHDVNRQESLRNRHSTTRFQVTFSSLSTTDQWTTGSFCIFSPFLCIPLSVNFQNPINALDYPSTRQVCKVHFLKPWPGPEQGEVTMNFQVQPTTLTNMGRTGKLIPWRWKLMTVE